MSEHPAPEKLKEQAETLLEELRARDESLKNKDRMRIPQQEMPEQEPDVRKENMEEVARGYCFSQAQVEAERCLQCKKAPCVEGCPVRIDIPAFIEALAAGDCRRSIDIIKQVSLLPAVCGRVCPQETQCQVECTVGKSLKDINKSVSIGHLERYVADWESRHGEADVPHVKPETGRRVAVVGTGPASITVAADVRRQGHAVVMFEAFHKAGGVLVYGIPEFRLPKSIVRREIEHLEKMGVQIQTDCVVGRTRKLADLLEKDGFDAVFIGTGAGAPRFMGIEGEELVGVFSANEYLTRSNLMRAYDRENASTPIYRSRKVAVLGGGNVAMDAARTAVRLGAEDVHLIYRRTEREMPARVEEVQHAKEEGVVFHVLQNAKRILGDENDRVEVMECLSYELGEPDESGRRRPVAIKGSEFLVHVDTVIVAIGNACNPLIAQTTPELETNAWGNIVVDENGKTSIDGIYAGGDIVSGAATVIRAMGEGRKAAQAINELLHRLRPEAGRKI